MNSLIKMSKMPNNQKMINQEPSILSKLTYLLARRGRISYAYLGAIFIILLTIIAGTKVFASSSSNDFNITSFGIDNTGVPFLTVLGKAGATQPGNSETLYAYLLYTDKGIFAVESGEGTGYQSHLIKLGTSHGISNCQIFAQAQGNTKFSGNMVKIQGISVTTVSHVSAVAFEIGSPEGTCISQIFSSKG
jgi:hypothetical protein